MTDISVSTPDSPDGTEETHAESAAVDAAVAAGAAAGAAHEAKTGTEQAVAETETNADRADDSATIASNAADSAAVAATVASDAAAAAGATLDSVQAAITELPDRIREALNQSTEEPEGSPGVIEVDTTEEPPAPDEPPKRNKFVDAWFGRSS